MRHNVGKGKGPTLIRCGVAGEGRRCRPTLTREEESGFGCVIRRGGGTAPPCEQGQRERPSHCRVGGEAAMSRRAVGKGGGMMPALPPRVEVPWRIDTSSATRAGKGEPKKGRPPAASGGGLGDWS